MFTHQEQGWYFNSQGYVQCYANLGTCRHATAQDIFLRSNSDNDMSTSSTKYLALMMAKNIITSMSYRAEPYMERFHSWTSELFPCMMAWMEFKSKFLVFELSETGMTNLSNMLSQALFLMQEGRIGLSICLHVVRILRLHVDRFRAVCGAVRTNTYYAISAHVLKDLRTNLLEIIYENSFDANLRSEASNIIASGLTLFFPEAKDQADLLIGIISVCIDTNLAFITDASVEPSRSQSMELVLNQY